MTCPDAAEHPLAEDTTRSSTLLGAEALLDTWRGHPVYVVLGVQGSGTNLLRRFLTRVFGFSVLQDHAVVFDAARRLGPCPSRVQVSKAIAAFHAHLRPSRLRERGLTRGIRAVWPFEGIERTLDPSAVRSGADLARVIYAYRASVVGARHMAIKSDDIWEHLDAIDTVLPERRVILLTRDFRDNLLSVTRKPFGPVQPLCAALYVKKRFAVYEAEYQRSGERGCLVRFETLANSPRAFVTAFAEHFGLSVVGDLDRALATITIRPGKAGGWRQLPAGTLRDCEGVLEPELRAHGYPLAFSDPPPPSRAALAAAHTLDFVGRIRQKLAVTSGKVLTD